MTKQTKAIIIGNVIYLTVFLIFWFLFPYIIENDSMASRGGITAVLTFIISPRITRIKMQSGDKYQIKWLFSNRAIVI